MTPSRRRTSPIAAGAPAVLIATLSILSGCTSSDDVAPSTVAPATVATATGTPTTTMSITATTAPAPVAVADGGIVESLRVEVVETVAHDPGAFTEGLVFDATGRLFESTGLDGESTLRELDPSSGEVVRSIALAPSLFGEGLALVGTRLVQITWQDQRAIVYDVDTFAEVRSFEYDGEGWGLCFDGAQLVMSNGSDQLTFRDPDTFAAVRTVEVTLEEEPVFQLNELECIDGRVYANIWKSDRIVQIDPATGVVVATIDASALERPATGDVLNGIAVDPEGGLWLTGKRWDSMYRVELVPG